MRPLIKRDQGNIEAGDEAGIRCRGVFETEGLQHVSAEEK